MGLPLYEEKPEEAATHGIGTTIADTGNKTQLVCPEVTVTSDNDSDCEIPGVSDSLSPHAAAGSWMDIAAAGLSPVPSGVDSDVAGLDLAHLTLADGGIDGGRALGPLPPPPPPPPEPRPEPEPQPHGGQEETRAHGHGAVRRPYFSLEHGLPPGEVLFSYAGAWIWGTYHPGSGGTARVDVNVHFWDADLGGVDLEALDDILYEYLENIGDEMREGFMEREQEG